MNVPTLHIYLVRDERAERFGTPLFTPLTGEQLAEQYRSSILKNIEKCAPLQDCVIYYVGEFDSVTGQIQELNSSNYELVVRLSDYVKEALAKLPAMEVKSNE